MSPVEQEAPHIKEHVFWTPVNGVSVPIPIKEMITTWVQFRRLDMGLPVVPFFTVFFLHLLCPLGSTSDRMYDSHLKITFWSFQNGRSKGD